METEKLEAIAETLTDYYDGSKIRPDKEYVVGAHVADNIYVYGETSAFGAAGIERVLVEHNAMPVKVTHTSQLRGYEGDKEGYCINFREVSIEEVERTVVEQGVTLAD